MAALILRKRLQEEKQVWKERIHVYRSMEADEIYILGYFFSLNLPCEHTRWYLISQPQLIQSSGPCLNCYYWFYCESFKDHINLETETFFISKRLAVHSPTNSSLRNWGTKVSFQLTGFLGVDWYSNGGTSSKSNHWIWREGSHLFWPTQGPVPTQPHHAELPSNMGEAHTCLRLSPSAFTDFLQLRIRGSCALATLRLFVDQIFYHFQKPSFK